MRSSVVVPTVAALLAASLVLAVMWRTDAREAQQALADSDATNSTLHAQVADLSGTVARLRDELADARVAHAAEVTELEDDLANLSASPPRETVAADSPSTPSPAVAYTVFGPVRLDHPDLVLVGPFLLGEDILTGADGCFPDLYQFCVGDRTYLIPEDVLQADYERCLAQATDAIECGP